MPGELLPSAAMPRNVWPIHLLRCGLRRRCYHASVTLKGKQCPEGCVQELTTCSFRHCGMQLLAQVLGGKVGKNPSGQFVLTGNEMFSLVSSNLTCCTATSAFCDAFITFNLCAMMYCLFMTHTQSCCPTRACFVTCYLHLPYCCQWFFALSCFLILVPCSFFVFVFHATNPPNHFEGSKLTNCCHCTVETVKATDALVSHPSYTAVAPQHKVARSFKIIQSHGEQVGSCFQIAVDVDCIVFLCEQVVGCLWA